MPYAKAIYDSVRATKSTAVERHGDAAMLVIPASRSIQGSYESAAGGGQQPPTKGTQIDVNGAGPTKTQKTQNAAAAKTRPMRTHAGTTKTQKTAAVKTVITPTASSKRAIDKVEPVLGRPPAQTAQTNSRNLSKDSRAAIQHQLAETNKARKKRRDKEDGSVQSGTKAVPGLKRSAETAELHILHVAKKLVKREVSAERASGRPKRAAAAVATAAMKVYTEDRDKAQNQLVEWAAEAAEMKERRQRLAASAHTPEPWLADSDSDSPSLSQGSLSESEEQDVGKAIAQEWVLEGGEWR
ncbi:hypothetical protein K438DRAFT_1949009 [Mycena galopus ATCC 62051]|nr:hypothetical protein K438DRAFT_1949009 [Mycena galopus ATCC 62051]